MSRLKPRGVAMSDEMHEKLAGLAKELYPFRGTRRHSEVVNRLILAAQVVDGKLVADERLPQPQPQ